MEGSPSVLASLGPSLAFIVVSGIVGLRLLLLARRTRQLPELAVGSGLFLVGAVSYPLGLVAQLGLAGETAAANLAAGLACVSVSVGSIAIYAFNRTVFRPREPWARWLSFAASGVLVAYAAVGVFRATTRPPGWYSRPDGWFYALELTLLLSYAWTTVEALHWYAMLRRRLALGLADPVVVNRFLMWALSGMAATGGVAGMLAVALGGAEPYHSAAARLGVGLGGSLASVVLWLAFAPPARYLRWLRRGSAAA